MPCRRFPVLLPLTSLVLALLAGSGACAAQTAAAPATTTPPQQLTRAVPRPPQPPAPAVLPPLPHPVLDRVRAAHSLSCGVSKEEEDYSRAEDHGNRAAFDIDFCKAVVAALLGPGARLVVKTYPDEPAAVQALLTGEVDLLASASPGVANTAKGLQFTQPVLFDGQGFLLANDPAVHSPLDLAGKKVCFLTGSEAEAGLHAYAAAHSITYTWYPFSEAGEMEAAFFTGNCDAISSDVTSLINIRGIGGNRATAYTVLPQLIRQDPLAAASYGDPAFAALLNWTLTALLRAEELGVTQNNVQAMLDSTNPAVQELVGQRFGTGSALGLSPHWAAFAVGAVGNYGELFARDLGAQSPFKLDRGENRLWTEGGLQFPLPLTVH